MIALHHVQVSAPPGCWFRALDDLDAVAAALTDAGLPIDLSQRDTFPGYQRLHTADPFGNRVELLALIA